MQLDLSSLRNAVGKLEQALAYCDSDLARGDPNVAMLFKSAAIQAFEFTYELSWKMLKRYLENAAATAQTIEEMAFPDLIRTGNEQGLLLSSWPTWKDFRRARSITSHVYDEAKADEVFAIVPRFLADARYLLSRLEERTTSP